MTVYLYKQVEAFQGLSTKDEYLLKVLLFGVAIFNAADYFMTTLTLSIGFKELNPIIDLIVYTPYFPLLKLFLIPLSLLFIWFQRYRIGRRILFYTWIAFIPYLLLMIYFKFIILVWFL